MRTELRGIAVVSGPLSGVKILDLTHVWAGPLAVRFLADFGALVVKVEAPTGRGPRAYPSAPIGGWLGGEPGDEPYNRNALFNKLARNRRSLRIDLKRAQGREVFLELVKMADVVVENFSARTMHALNLDYAALSTENPQIIYLSMPGFGASGPLKDRVAFGPTVEVMSGLTTMMGYGPQEPRNTAMALMDPVTATNAAAALSAALVERQRSGKGCHLEMSLHEGGVNYCGPWLIDHQLQATQQCIGNRHPNMCPHGVFACAGEDQWLALACANQQQWQALCSLVKTLQPEMTLMARRDHEATIEADIRRWCAGQDKASAVSALQQAGVPAGSVNNVPEMVADPHTQARGFFVPYERFDTPMPGNPVHMQGLNSAQWTPCPSLGEHNAEVLRDWLGYDDAKVAELTTTHVLADRPPA